MNKTLFAETISNEDVALLPMGQFLGEIIVVEDENNIRKACDYLMSQKIVGFDTETRPAFTAGIVNKVALLQLSTAERCFLFRLNKMRLDKAIIKILENKNILKIGADIKCDIRAMQQLRKFHSNNFIDLQQIIGNYGIQERSVRKMAAITLGLRISKAQRLSNWEAVQLTASQQMYAATDAWVTLMIYNELIKHTYEQHNT